MGYRQAGKIHGNSECVLAVCWVRPGAGCWGHAMSAGWLCKRLQVWDEPVVSLPVTVETFYVLKALGDSWLWQGILDIVAYL